MTAKKSTRWGIHLHHLPAMAHIVELAVALVIFSAVSGVWGILVGADPDITPPSVPTGLQVTSETATEIDFSWTASTDNVGVTGYHVYRNGVQLGATTNTNYADTGLAPNTTYSYTVSAYDAASNESSQSNALAATTLADTSPPSVPVNLHQTDASVSSVTIAWNASADNVGVTGYRVYRNGALVSTQSSTSFTDSGLAVYSGYNYNVTAFDAAGNTSNLSATLVASTSPDTSPPSVPDNIHETGQTVSTITLAWNASSDNVGVTGYHIYRDGSLIATIGGTSYTDSGLTVSSSYEYNLTAYDAAGNVSNQSATFTASSSNDTTPPTIPANVQTTATYDTSVAIAWNASTDNVGVTGYKVYRNSVLIASTGANTTNYTDTGLQPVTNYTYTIEAFDAANNVSSPSAGDAVTTAFDTTPPSVPTNLRTTAITDQTVTLAWDAATDNVAVSGYDLYRNGTLITSTVGTTYTDSGLSVSTAYSYTIRAHDASGNNSAQSSPLGVSTIADQVPPSTPTGLASSNQTITSITLTWNASTDDMAVAGYKLYRNGSLVTTTDANTLTYTDSGLHYNMSYTYTVAAADTSGNISTVSAGLPVATLPDTVPPTLALTAPSNNQTIELTVPLTATASDAIAGISRVVFTVDGQQVASLSTSPYGLNWDSYAFHNGWHTLTATAYDGAGNMASQSISVAIANPPPPLVGDLNGDHKVNLFDLAILLAHWNKPGPGDFNNNGKVDIFDLAVLLSHYGQDNSNYH